MRSSTARAQFVRRSLAKHSVTVTTFLDILAALPPETLDNAIGQWSTARHMRLSPWTGRTCTMVAPFS